MTLRVAAGCNPALLFDDPVHVWAPATVREALAALDLAQQAMDDGLWIAGALSYEFGALLNGIGTRACSPLLVLGAFREPTKLHSYPQPPDFELTAPLAHVPFDSYASRVRYLIERIREGEVYQVNYTVPFESGFRGDPFDLYTFLAERADAPYSAFLQYGDLSIVSISPELFLGFDGRRIRTKPMKGTAGLDRIADLGNEKNLSEHLMIVDLLRNDLHRICTNVRVEHLFQVETYPTFATMTSTIEGDLGRDESFARIVRATFPCGSVTGAPKRAAMEHIAQVETRARGFYTGSIGYLSPERRGWWNVAIRTLQIRADSVRFDAGGGIVSDSQPEQEWDEILLKSRFLAPAHEQFAVLETLRGGPEPSDTAAHARRLTASARAFGFPIDFEEVHERLEAAVQSQRAVLVRARLNRHGLRVFLEDLDEPQLPVRLCMSPCPVRSGDVLLRHKTSWRPIHEAAYRHARDRACFDAILCNERGEITEGSRTNIFVQIGNTLYTPPVDCGALPGILRAKLVSEGKAVERVLFTGDLTGAQAVFAGNSARGLLPARLQYDAT